MITSGADPVELGSLKITFIGPTPETLKRLQKEWLRKFKNKQVQKTIRKLRERMAEDIADLASGAVSLADVRTARAAARLACRAPLPLVGPWGQRLDLR